MRNLIVAVFFCISVSVFAEDMQKHLSDTQMMVRQGMYQEALDRFVWFHDHALEHNYGMYGVRLSFALMYWKELGKVYLQAMQALKETRDHKTDQILNSDGNYELFNDVVFCALSDCGERVHHPAGFGLTGETFGWYSFRRGVCCPTLHMRRLK
jgi:hypothetical protein